MPIIPFTNDVLVLRTHFGDDAAWHQLMVLIQTPEPEVGAVAYVEFMDDPQFQGLSPDQVVASLDPSHDHNLIFIADEAALTSPEFPVLCVNLMGPRNQSFRAIPAMLWAVENNLSTAEMAWEDITACLDADGVFRQI